MVKIDINNQSINQISDKAIKTVLKRSVDFLKKEGIIKLKQSVNLSVALVKENDIAKLNWQYRSKKGSTDVLSFCYDKTDQIINGEIILAPKVIKKYAKEDGCNFKSEFGKNLVHGLLHIIGFEHSEKMFNLQESLLEKVII